MALRNTLYQALSTKTNLFLGLIYGLLVSFHEIF